MMINDFEEKPEENMFCFLVTLPTPHTSPFVLQTEYAQENALRANAVHLRGVQYPIMRVDPFMTPVVRLTNIGLRPEEHKIAATCELFGQVEKVVARSDTMVDVYFQTSEIKKMPRILNR
jgi:hypothetical protein